MTSGMGGDNCGPDLHVVGGHGRGERAADDQHVDEAAQAEARRLERARTAGEQAEDDLPP